MLPLDGVEPPTFPLRKERSYHCAKEARDTNRYTNRSWESGLVGVELGVTYVPGRWSWVSAPCFRRGVHHWKSKVSTGAQACRATAVWVTSHRALRPASTLRAWLHAVTSVEDGWVCIVLASTRMGSLQGSCQSQGATRLWPARLPAPPAPGDRHRTLPNAQSL